MPFKSQFKLIVSSFIVLLVIPILLYFLGDDALRQFIIDFSSYFGAVISIVGIYSLMISFIKHREMIASDENKLGARGYFQIEKITESADFPNLALNKSSKLLITENFKQYETKEKMNFIKLNLVTEAQLILNLEINLAYKDLSFIDTLYIARMEKSTELFLPERLSQTVENRLKHVGLKSLELKYETLAGEKMRLFFEEDYQKVNCFGEDQAGNEVKLYTEHLSGIELRSLR